MGEANVITNSEELKDKNIRDRLHEKQPRKKHMSSYNLSYRKNLNVGIVCYG